MNDLFVEWRYFPVNGVSRQYYKQKDKKYNIKGMYTSDTLTSPEFPVIKIIINNIKSGWR